MCPVLILPPLDMLWISVSSRSRMRVFWCARSVGSTLRYDGCRRGISGRGGAGVFGYLVRAPAGEVGRLQLGRDVLGIGISAAVSRAGRLRLAVLALPQRVAAVQLDPDRAPRRRRLVAIRQRLGAAVSRVHCRAAELGAPSPPPSRTRRRQRTTRSPCPRRGGAARALALAWSPDMGCSRCSSSGTASG